jgi:amino acid transporter
VQGWAEGISADPAANQDLRNRLMFPLEIPVTAALVVGFVVISFSRVLLALPKNASTVVAIIVAASILGVSTLIASKPRLSSSVISAVIAIGVLIFLVAGIVTGVSGHRTFHKEKDEGVQGASAHVLQSVAYGQETNSR